MRTRGWVVKDSNCLEYWTDEDSNLGSRKEARVYLTKFCAVAARDLVCSASCCRVYRLTSRPRKS